MNLPVCTKILALGVATILLIVLSGCKKDYPVSPATESFPSALSDGGKITIDDARKWFENVQNRDGIESLNLPGQMYPMWYLAKPSKFRGTLDIIIVPIAAKDSMVDIGAYNGAKLIVFKDQNGEINGNVALFNSAAATSNLTSTFTGYFTTFSLAGNPLSSVQVANGVLVGGATSLDSIAAYTAAPDCSEYECPPAIHWICELLGLSHVHCPSAGGSSGSGAGAGGNLGGGWSGGSGSGGPFGTGTIYLGTGGTVIRIGSSSEGEPVGSGVGSNNTFNNYFENEIFGTETMFNHPMNYPCKNQNLNNPEGEGPVISSLLKAKANGLGNFASQWLALMASGQYGSPAEALDNINWTTVSASNTNDLIDGSLANNALLQATIAMLNQAETNGCEFTVDQAWEALSEQSSQIGCLLNTAQQIGGIPPAQFNALLRNLDIACTFSTFLGQQNNSSEARTFVTDMIAFMLELNQTDLTPEELNFLFISLPEIDVSSVPPTNEPISVSHPMCAQIMPFKTLEDPVSHLNYSALILNNSYFRFSVSGSTSETIHIQQIKFQVDANLNNACLVSSSVFAANAMNSATLATQQFINALPPGPLSDFDKKRLKTLFLKTLSRAFENGVKACNTYYRSSVYIANTTANWNNFPEVNCDEAIINCQ